jgi:hypothetical protein
MLRILIAIVILVTAQTVRAEMPEEKLSLATKLVVDCYLERIKVDAAKGLLPNAHEVVIRRECSARENFLKIIVNDTVDPAIETLETYVADVRQRSVAKYFSILGLLHPQYKDRCPDKSYACAVRQK